MKIMVSDLLNIFFVFLMSQTAQSPKAETSAGVVLKLIAPGDALKSCSEVRLEVLITNVTDHDLKIVRSPGIIPEEQLRYEIEIRDSAGKEPPETSYFKEYKSPSAIVQFSNIGHTLKPGESVTDRIVLTKLYDLRAPGKYRVRVTRPIPWDGGVLVKSNEITITIVEPNP